MKIFHGCAQKNVIYCPETYDYWCKFASNMYILPCYATITCSVSAMTFASNTTFVHQTKTSTAAKEKSGWFWMEIVLCEIYVFFSCTYTSCLNKHQNIHIHIDNILKHTEIFFENFYELNKKIQLQKNLRKRFWVISKKIVFYVRSNNFITTLIQVLWKNVFTWSHWGNVSRN